MKKDLKERRRRLRGQSLERSAPEGPDVPVSGRLSVRIIRGERLPLAQNAGKKMTTSVLARLKLILAQDVAQAWESMAEEHCSDISRDRCGKPTITTAKDAAADASGDVGGGSSLVQHGDIDQSQKPLLTDASGRSGSHVPTVIAQRVTIRGDLDARDGCVAWGKQLAFMLPVGAL